MQIDTESIIGLLQNQGMFAEAQAAAAELPAMIDPIADGSLLEGLGIDPSMVIDGLGLADQVSGLQDQAGEYGQGVTDITEGGLSGIFEKISSFLGGGRN